MVTCIGLGTDDALHHLTVVTDTVGSVTRASYDAIGQLTSVTDPLSRTVQFQYNDLGQLIRQTDAAGVVTAYEYDLVGQLVAVTANYRPGFAPPPRSTCAPATHTMRAAAY